MKALVIGATGATGKELVQVLLNSPDYSEVAIFVRRPLGITHPKLEEVLTDFNYPEDIFPFINGDVLFSCLGTTLKTAGSKEKQWHIDYGIPLAFATLAKKNGVNNMVLLSAYGAAPNSHVFYSQVKGKLEDAIGALGFDQYIIFRPGLLLRQDTDRFGEKASASILQVLNAIGILKKFKPMPTALLAQKMAKAPGLLPAGQHIIALDKIFSF